MDIKHYTQFDSGSKDSNDRETAWKINLDLEGLVKQFQKKRPQHA